MRDVHISAPVRRTPAEIKNGAIHNPPLHEDPEDNWRYGRGYTTCHVHHTRLSVYIQRLETMLAHRLFDRKARGVTPTIAGRHFYACRADVLKTVSIAKQRTLDMAGNVAADINVGVSPTLFKGVLPWMLPDYLSALQRHAHRLGSLRGGSGCHRHQAPRAFRAGGDSLFPRPARTRHARELQELKLILPSPRHSLRQVIEAAAVPWALKDQAESWKSTACLIFGFITWLPTFLSRPDAASPRRWAIRWLGR